MGRKHGSSRTRYSSLVWLAHPVLLESALPCSCTHYLEHFLCCLPSCSWLITPANSGRSLSLLYVTAVSSVTADFGHLLVCQALIPCRTSAASSILPTLLLAICPRLGGNAKLYFKPQYGKCMCTGRAWMHTITNRLQLVHQSEGLILMQTRICFRG